MPPSRPELVPQGRPAFVFPQGAGRDCNCESRPRGLGKIRCLAGGGDKQTPAELSQMKGQMVAVEQASIAKKCNIQFQGQRLQRCRARRTVSARKTASPQRPRSSSSGRRISKMYLGNCGAGRRVRRLPDQPASKLNRKAKATADTRKPAVRAWLPRLIAATR